MFQNNSQLEQQNSSRPVVFLQDISPLKLPLVSLISAIFIIYPNMAMFFWERGFLTEDKHIPHLLFFIFRYLFFSALIWILLKQYAVPADTEFKKMIIRTFLIAAGAYLIYVICSRVFSPKHEWYSGLLLFQFLVAFILCSLLGYVSQLYQVQRAKEKEIERLKIENLQSRYDALTNQINPHFFFNSLNGLSSLIRKSNEENTIDYLNKLSDVFRYILRSDKKELVTLEEELGFVKAFSYMMEVRFANKLVFNINVPDEFMLTRIPVLSLLPLIDNVAIHNTIDSKHKMEVDIGVNHDMELTVSNPIFPKLIPAESNGTGLLNLENRFWLLMEKKIRIENSGNKFTVYLPLKRINDENSDRGG